MNAAPRQNEATMEDIMASIRRIVGDDKTRIAQPTPQSKPVGFKNEPILPANDLRPVHQAKPVLNLTDAVLPVETVDNTRALDPRGMVADIDFKTSIHDYSKLNADVKGNDSILSAEANAALSASFAQLNKTFQSQNELVESAVKDMLQPMLKEWLDNNLPPMVEKIIRAEIERVARGGR